MTHAILLVVAATVVYLLTATAMLTGGTGEAATTQGRHCVVTELDAPTYTVGELFALRASLWSVDDWTADLPTAELPAVTESSAGSELRALSSADRVVAGSDITSTASGNGTPQLPPATTHPAGDLTPRPSSPSTALRTACEHSTPIFATLARELGFTDWLVTT